VTHGEGGEGGGGEGRTGGEGGGEGRIDIVDTYVDSGEAHLALEAR